MLDQIIVNNVMCPFKQLAKRHSERIGENIDLDHGWCLFLPIYLKPRLGELPKNVYYTDVDNFPFFSRVPEDFLKDPMNSFSAN